jgi:hypothetical protein
MTVLKCNRPTDGSMHCSYVRPALGVPCENASLDSGCASEHQSVDLEGRFLRDCRGGCVSPLGRFDGCRVHILNVLRWGQC